MTKRFELFGDELAIGDGTIDVAPGDDLQDFQRLIPVSAQASEAGEWAEDTNSQSVWLRGFAGSASVLRRRIFWVSLGHIAGAVLRLSFVSTRLFATKKRKQGKTLLPYVYPLNRTTIHRLS